MKNILLAGVMVVALVIPAAAQAASFVLVTLGFVYGAYPTVDACLAAGASIKSNIDGGTYIPPYYCVPVTNVTNPPVGGGAGGSL